MTNKTKRTKLDRAREVADGADTKHTCHNTQKDVCPMFWTDVCIDDGGLPHRIAASMMLEGTYGGRWKQGSR